MGLALRYEDLNGHDTLRHDLIFGFVSGRLSGSRANRAVLAGKSTLNRQERSSGPADRYCRIIADHDDLTALLVTVFPYRHEFALLMHDCDGSGSPSDETDTVGLPVLPEQLECRAASWHPEKPPD